jgi:hypothetical protein
VDVLVGIDMAWLFAEQLVERRKLANNFFPNRTGAL